MFALYSDSITFQSPTHATVVFFTLVFIRDLISYSWTWNFLSKKRAGGRCKYFCHVRDTRSRFLADDQQVKTLKREIHTEKSSLMMNLINLIDWCVQYSHERVDPSIWEGYDAGILFIQIWDWIARMLQNFCWCFVLRWMKAGDSFLMHLLMNNCISHTLHSSMHGLSLIPDSCHWSFVHINFDRAEIFLLDNFWDKTGSTRWLHESTGKSSLEITVESH